MASGMHNLFVYGTLQDMDLFAAISGVTPGEKKFACLHGFSHSEPIFGYPVIRKDENGVVEGEIIFGLSRTILENIDRYENCGELYDRILVNVDVDGTTVPAYVYIGYSNP